MQINKIQQTNNKNQQKIKYLTKNHDTFFKESRYFPLVPGAGTTRNHGTFLQKSPRKVAEITATSCGNPKEKLRKS